MTIENDGAVAENTDAKPVDAAEVETQETEVQEAEDNKAEERDETADAVAEGPAEDADKDKTRQKSRTREYIESLKQQKREAEKRAKEAEAELTRIKAEKPKREDFEDDDDYQDARLEYREAIARKRAIEQTTERARHDIESTRVQAWQQRVAEVSEEIPDLVAVITNPHVPITREVAELLMDSDQGPQLAYRLAKNPALAAEIAQMSEREAARAIGRLEAETSPKPKKISAAPPPVETVTSRGAATGFDPARASPDDFARMFRQNTR